MALSNLRLGAIVCPSNPGPLKCLLIQRISFVGSLTLIVDAGLSDTSDSPFLFSGPNEVYVAFAVRPEGAALQEELNIISRELDGFCAMLQDARWEQVDLATLYPKVTKLKWDRYTF